MASEDPSAPSPSPQSPATQPAQESGQDESQLPPCCAVGGDAAAPAPSPQGDQGEISKPSGAEAQLEPNGQTPTPARAGQWIEPVDRAAFDLDFNMTNQDGVSLNMSSLVGMPTAVSFIYTRCPDPKMCPLIVVTTANLQRDLKVAGFNDKVQLLLISYDPVYDTPERLKAFGQDRGLAFGPHAMMLRPEIERFRELLHEFQLGVDYQPDGSIGHFIEMLVIDAQGRFVRDYQGSVWDNAAVLGDLKRLVAEQESNPADTARP